jgi:uracil-DNA glycosylase
VNLSYDLRRSSCVFDPVTPLRLDAFALQGQPYVQTPHLLSIAAKGHTRPAFTIMASKKSRQKEPVVPESATASGTAAELIPPNATLQQLQSAARGCKACDLWKLGTQTVFGEGLPRARVMFVGEQPGDQEDRVGRPFVGPAGRVLDLALSKAGIDRAEVYVTNVVKHFKWSPAERGKRRIHKKPRYSEMQACRPWLDAELEVVQPQVLVCLGASAAQSLLGRDFRVSQQRGQLLNSDLAPFVIATVHPSSILRAQNEDSRHLQMEAFIDDLKNVAQLVKTPRKVRPERKKRVA